ncbi:MAG: hypothetical protein RLY58_2239 [Pseudomonadota bacterium]|jgi:hypothetical protein
MLRWKILGLILLLPAMAAQAEIYRSVDAKGNVLFSDVPAPKAERVRLPPLSIIPGMSPEDMARANGSNDSPRAASRPTSYRISFSAPAANLNLRKPSDTLEIAVNTDPALASSDQLNLMIDGVPLSGSNSASVPTERLDRGAHVVQARVTNQNGRVLGEQSVTVFVQQFSKIPATAVKTAKR